MDPNFEKCTFLTFLSIEPCACSLIFAHSFVIDVSPLSIERGMRRGGSLNKGCSSRDANREPWEADQ